MAHNIYTQGKYFKETIKPFKYSKCSIQTGTSKTTAQQECDDHERISNYFRKAELRNASAKGADRAVEATFDHGPDGWKKAGLEAGRGFYQGVKEHLVENMQKPYHEGNMPIDQHDELQRRLDYKWKLTEHYGRSNTRSTDQGPYGNNQGPGSQGFYPGGARQDGLFNSRPGQGYPGNY